MIPVEKTGIQMRKRMEDGNFPEKFSGDQALLRNLRNHICSAANSRVRELWTSRITGVSIDSVYTRRSYLEMSIASR